jgi:hypothetical protein
VRARRPVRRLIIAAGLLLAQLLAPDAGAARAPATPDLTATRALVKKLKATGRGEASITVVQSDPLGGPDHVQAGRLALEPPDRVRLDFPATGERVTLRGNGGEWIQPQARQMLRLEREQASMAAWLWEILLLGGTSGFGERVAGPRRFVLEPRDREAGLPGAITVEIDSFGLPVQIEFAELAGATTRYRFKGWRFVRPRGPAGFTLTAPRGYATVEVP